jgi:hypothetical protein
MQRMVREAVRFLVGAEALPGGGDEPHEREHRRGHRDREPPSACPYDRGGAGGIGEEKISGPVEGDLLTVEEPEAAPSLKEPFHETAPAAEAAPQSPARGGGPTVRTEEISQAGRGVNAGAPSSGGIRDTIGAAASSLLSSLVSGVTGAASGAASGAAGAVSGLADAHVTAIRGAVDEAAQTTETTGGEAAEQARRRRRHAHAGAERRR